MIQERKSAVEKDWKEYQSRPSNPRLRAMLRHVSVAERSIKRGTTSQAVYDIKFLVDFSLVPSDLTPVETESLLQLVHEEGVKLIKEHGITYEGPGRYGTTDAVTSYTVKKPFAPKARKLESSWNEALSPNPITRGPVSPKVLQAMIVGYVSMARFPQAIELFQQHAPKQPDQRYGSTIGQVIYAYILGGRTHAASTDMAEFIRKDWLDVIDDAVALGNIASLYALSQQAEPAIDCIRRALSKKSPSFTLDYLRGEKDFDPIRGHPDFKKLFSS